MSFEISSERPENQFKYPAWGPFTSLGTRSQIKSSEPVKSPALQGADPLSLPLHTDLSILVALESDKQVLPMFPPPSLPQGRSEARVLEHRHLWATPFLGKPFVMEGLCPPPALCSPFWPSCMCPTHTHLRTCLSANPAPWDSFPTFCVWHTPYLVRLDWITIPPDSPATLLQQTGSLSLSVCPE